MQFSGRMMLVVTTLLCMSAVPVASASVRASEDPSAVRKVVTLLEDMKKQVTKDGSDDQVAYDKYACWAETNKKEKEEAVENAKNKINELESLIEESAATQGQLKSEIEGLEADMASDKESLQEATGIRGKENAAFVSASDEMKEAIGALTEAVAVLSKVNLLQKNGHSVTSPKLRLQLLQVRDSLKNIHDKKGMFKNVMQKDLWDVMGVLGGSASGTFLGHGSSLAQQGQPKPKSDEQLGMEAKPNDLKGLGAGAKSYNSRSGEVYGILNEMLDEFKRDLAEAKKKEATALKMFNDLKAAKESEIAAAKDQVDAKSKDLADAIQAEAQAKEDVESTTKSLEADQEFLLTLAENSKKADEEYASRVKARDEEIVALDETIKILTGDEARSLFDRTLSFLQMSKRSAANARSKMMNQAMQRVMRTARKNGNWLLASLAVRMKLDAFTKVKAMMDKMSADLKKEQEAEIEKYQYCMSAIDKTEDDIKVAEREKEDLTTLKVRLEGAMSKYTVAIAELKEQVKENEISLKEAGEQRKAENMVYQKSVADQRATLHVLQMAYDRLKVFYEPKKAASMAQIATPPPMGTGAYEKNEHGGGVLQMLMTIITDAKNDEIILVGDEQQSQKDYAKFALETTASIEADKEQILEKSKLLESATAKKAETDASLITNAEEISELASTLAGYHSDCDWLIKYFDVRQTARNEEIEAIAEAKAILSGAKFSEALEAGAEAAA